MTDSSSKTQVRTALPRAITADQFARFAAAKGVDTSCHRCKASITWTVHEYTDSRGAGALLINADGGVNLTTYIPLLLISCSNCGLVWAVARNKVGDWLDEQEAKANV